MQFWFASQRSVSASWASTCVFVPPLRRGVSTRATQSGAPFGMSCWTTRCLSIPAFQRHRFSGRSRTCTSITSATDP
jgi:hypothetical protein